MHVCLEPLESRTMLSAAPTTTSGKSLDQILRYDLRAASWTYDITADTPFGSASSRATISVNAPSPKRIKVTTTAQGGRTTMVLAKTTQGVELVGFVSVSQGMKMRFNASAVVLSPKRLQAGKSYRDSGQVAGTVTITTPQGTARGQFQGNAKAITKLGATGAVSVPAGDFAAADIVSYSMAFSGAVRITAAGQTINAQFSTANNFTAWTDPSLGVVQQQQTTRYKIAAQGLGKDAGSVTSFAELVSTSLGT